MNIAIIGAGNVGGALGTGWAQAGHTVKFGVQDPTDAKVKTLLTDRITAGTVVEATSFAEVIVFAIPWGAMQDAIANAGNLTGKVVLDCTNPIKADFSNLTCGYSTSGGEQVANWAPGAHVVKIFNTTGANVMADAQFGSARTGREGEILPAMFYCGDNVMAKQTAAQLAVDLGFDAIDAGPLTQARLLEPLAWLWITMALKYGHGREMAFALLRR